MRKYELTKETKTLLDGTVLHRIRALLDIPRYGVKAGDLGGWIEKKKKTISLNTVTLGFPAMLWFTTTLRFAATLWFTATLRFTTTLGFTETRRFLATRTI